MPSDPSPDPHRDAATVSDIMSGDVVTIDPDTALMEIRRLLHERGFHHLLVTEDGSRLAGVISDRDVLRVISPFLDTRTETPRDVQTLERPAREIMRADPITTAPQTPVAEAARVLLDNDISSLPVVEKGRLAGILTTKDVLAHYAASDS
jgi:acetoin utilization protein AcuB